MSVTNMHEETGLLSATISRRVRGLLAERGMNQQDLAPLLGVSGSATSKRIRGLMAFPVDELPVLATALDTSIEYLMGLTEVRARRDSNPKPSDLYPAAPAPRAVEPVPVLATVLPFRRAAAAPRPFVSSRRGA